jgi:Ca2+/H+ antiporter
MKIHNPMLEEGEGYEDNDDDDKPRCKRFSSLLNPIILSLSLLLLCFYISFLFFKLSFHFEERENSASEFSGRQTKIKDCRMKHSESAHDFDSLRLGH